MYVHIVWKHLLQFEHFLLLVNPRLHKNRLSVLKVVVWKLDIKIKENNQCMERG